jgi:hypothetical protein
VSWLIGSTLASFVAAFIVIKLFDYVFSGVTGTLGNVARAGVFIVTWTAITAKLGMHGFSKRIRNLRKGIASFP